MYSNSPGCRERIFASSSWCCRRAARQARAGTLHVHTTCIVLPRRCSCQSRSPACGLLAAAPTVVYLQGPKIYCWCRACPHEPNLCCQMADCAPAFGGTNRPPSIFHRGAGRVIRAAQVWVLWGVSWSRPCVAASQKGPQKPGRSVKPASHRPRGDSSTSPARLRSHRPDVSPVGDASAGALGRGSSWSRPWVAASQKRSQKPKGTVKTGLGPQMASFRQLGCVPIDAPGTTP